MHNWQDTIVNTWRQVGKNSNTPVNWDTVEGENDTLFDDIEFENADPDTQYIVESLGDDED